MTGIQIELMKESHVAEMEAITQACFSEPWSRESILADVNNPRCISLVAFYDEEIAGFLCAFCICDEGTVNLVAVKESFRGHGIAKALFSAFIESAKEQGIKHLFLEVRESNQAAISLYRKFGFVQYSRRNQIYKEPVEDALLMAANI